MISRILAVLLLIGAIYWSFYVLLPDPADYHSDDPTTFSLERAKKHVQSIAKYPHFVTSAHHDEVKDYLFNELRKLGFDTTLQSGYAETEKWASVAYVQNILARKKGTGSGSALVLMSHYDSSPSTSLGASDAGSGVATILEGLRAYLHDHHTHKNDLILIFTDGEELGLMGAELFVDYHPWAKDAGLLLNFEARGSGGPSYMLMETNGGNSALIKAFHEANTSNPVANSLAYSIYKLLPNDMDLTVCREQGDMIGYNFAFIDDHFDYHTALDKPGRLDDTSLAHQASYLMPLLSYFSDFDLVSLRSKSGDDHVYFSTPFGITMYPFYWGKILFWSAIFLFLLLLIYLNRRRALTSKSLIRGFIVFVLSLLILGGLGYFLWPLLQNVYPQYKEVLQKFPYNGRDYIAFMCFLSLSTLFFIYSKVMKEQEKISFTLTPILFGLILGGFLTYKLPGGSFLLLPVLFGMLLCFTHMHYPKANPILFAIISAFPLMIVSPYLVMFPVGLGLGMLVVSGSFVVLLFGLLLLAIHATGSMRMLSPFLLMIALAFLIKAHYASDFSADNPKPNSLNYFFDYDAASAFWATYDYQLDSYTKGFIGETPMTTTELFTMPSKYGTSYRFAARADVIALTPGNLKVIRDSIVGTKRTLECVLFPYHPINKLEIASDTLHTYYSMSVDNHPINIGREGDFILKSSRKKTKDLLLTIWPKSRDSLHLYFEIPKDQSAEFTLYETSFDLSSSSLLNMPQRADDMIPKPFVTNDAIIIKHKISL